MQFRSEPVVEQRAMIAAEPHRRPRAGRRWKEMPCKLDEREPAKAAIGLVALANDISIEPEVSKFLPLDGVSLYSNRIAFPEMSSVEALRSLEKRIAEAAALINPGGRLDAIAFGCSSAVAVIGRDVVAGCLRRARFGLAATDPMTASIAGFRKLECATVAVLTPYGDDVNAVVEDYIESNGLKVGARASFKRGRPEDHCRISPESIYNAGLEIGRAEVDGLLICCTSLRVSSIIGKLEADIGKPVVSSNQATAWHALRLAGCVEPVEGYGRLLTI